MLDLIQTLSFALTLMTFAKKQVILAKIEPHVDLNKKRF